MKTYIKIFFLYGYLFFIASSYATSNIISCTDQGKDYGSVVGAVLIEDDCFDLFQAAASDNATVKSADNTILAFGYNNILFAEINDSNLSLSKLKVFISGKQALLNSVHAVSLDMVNRHIIVLANNDYSVYSFRIDVGGNVSPMLRLVSPLLEGAFKVKVNHSTDELMVVKKDDRKILFFERRANAIAKQVDSSTGLKTFSSTSLKRSLSANGAFDSPYDIAASSSKKEIYVLDNEQKRIFVFDENAKNNDAHKLVLSTENVGILNPVKIDFDEANSEIKITGSNNQVATIKR